MNSIKISVEKNGAVSPEFIQLGHAGEHNVLTLQFQLPSELIETVDYFRLDFGGVLTERLYAENGIVSYKITQGVLVNGGTLLQLEGIKITDGKVAVLFKSDIIRASILYSVSCCKEIPNEAYEPLETAISELDNLLKNAEKYENSLGMAEASAESAKASETNAKSSEEVASAAAATATEYGNRAIESAQIAINKSQIAEDMAQRATHSEAVAKESADNAKNAEKTVLDISLEMAQGLDTMKASKEILEALPKEEVTESVINGACEFLDASYYFEGTDERAYRYMIRLNTILYPDSSYKLEIGQYLDVLQIGEVFNLAVGTPENVVLRNVLINFDFDNYEKIWAEFKTPETVPQGAPVYVVFSPLEEFQHYPESCPVKLERTALRPTESSVSGLIKSGENSMLVYRNEHPEWESYMSAYAGYAFYGNPKLIKGLNYKVRIYCTAPVDEPLYFSDGNDIFQEMTFNEELSAYECRIKPQRDYQSTESVQLAWMCEWSTINSKAFEIYAADSFMDIIGKLYDAIGG